MGPNCAHVRFGPKLRIPCLNALGIRLFAVFSALVCLEAFVSLGHAPLGCLPRLLQWAKRRRKHGRTWAAEHLPQTRPERSKSSRHPRSLAHRRSLIPRAMSAGVQLRLLAAKLCEGQDGLRHAGFDAGQLPELQGSKPSFWLVECSYVFLGASHERERERERERESVCVCARLHICMNIFTHPCACARSWWLPAKPMAHKLVLKPRLRMRFLQNHDSFLIQ